MTGMIVGALVESAVRSTGLVMLMALTLRLLRTRSGALRHAAWTAVVTAMLLMPILPRLLPSFALPSISTPTSDVAAAGTVSSGPAFPSPATRAGDGGSGDGPLRIRASAVPPPRVSNTDHAGPTTFPVFSVASVLPVLFALYAAGVLVFTSRLFFGYRSIARLRRGSRPLSEALTLTRRDLEVARATDGGDSDLFESPAVATPVTVGVMSPRIVLPLAWRSWSSHTLSAVLAHERAHVRRHDALVAFVAQMNCCVFWFHPLSWWLVRRLSATAEQACDQDVVRTTGAPQRYAQVLIEMAAAAGRAGGRFAWQGMGVDGDGCLGSRIDDILRNDHTPASWTQRAAVVASCVVVILAVAGCQRQTVPPPLKADPTLAADLAERRVRSEFSRAALALTPTQAAEVEATLAGNPEDAVARERLLIYYRWTGKNAQPWNDNVTARRRHALWLTQHHPDSDLLAMAIISPHADPDGHAQVRALWLARLATPIVDTKILANAARFFEESEKPMAERLLLKAKAIEPDEPEPRVAKRPSHPSWSAELGRLYAEVILGSIGSMQFNVVRETDAREARSQYAMEVRRTLESSRDPVLLRTTAEYLAIWNVGSPDSVSEHLRLARSYAEHVQQIEPGSRETTRLVKLITTMEEYRSRPLQRSPFAGVAPESRDGILGQMPAGERLRWLTALADEDYENASAMEYVKNTPEKKVEYPQAATELAKNPDAIRAARERSTRYAQRALDFAATVPKDPAYGNAIYRNNLTLAANAVWDGDRPRAVRYMLAAAQAPKPAGPEERRFPGNPENALTRSLLKAGERTSVAEYLERSSEGRDPNEAARMREEAAAIRDGRMPKRYQILLADER